MIKLGKKRSEKLIIQIISDSIIVERTYRGVNEMLRSFNPKTKPWEAESNYHGVSICFSLLGYKESFKDEEVTDKLFSDYMDTVNEDFKKPAKERCTAKALAKKIYFNWVITIK